MTLNERFPIHSGCSRLLGLIFILFQLARVKMVIVGIVPPKFQVFSKTEAFWVNPQSKA